VSRCLTAPIRQHDISDNNIELAFAEFARFPNTAYSLDIISATSQHGSDHCLIGGIVFD
jgi:hypothetical protein